MPVPTAVLLYAHGSRDPAWARPFERLRELLAARAPGLAVALAFLEHMRPTLDEAVATLAARGAERITVIPLFMGRGGHLRVDLPARMLAAGERHPGVVLRAAPAVGEVDAVLDAIADWVIAEDAWTRDTDPGGPLA